MSNTGKHLEELVAFAERQVSHLGCSITTNDKIFNEDGVQIAEFDVLIEGLFGTTKISWLIECRDRPGSGGAPGSWIEQLVGRRQRFGFNKVTAVSTTGFTPSALEFAEEAGIELREVLRFTEHEFEDFFPIPIMSYRLNNAQVESVYVHIAKDNPPDLLDTIQQKLTKAGAEQMLLAISPQAEATHTLVNAAMGALAQQKDIWEQVEKNGGELNVHLQTHYQPTDCFYINTEKLTARVEKIDFKIKLKITDTPAPVKIKARYRGISDGAAIVDSALYEPAILPTHELSIELRHMPSTGQTYFTVSASPPAKIKVNDSNKAD